MGYFKNGLKAGHFKEFLALKPLNMDEVKNETECYIKDEERNMDK